MEINDSIKAIEIIFKAKRTHIYWAEFLRANPNAESESQYAYVGSIEHHEKYIYEYDSVISCIQALTAEVESTGKAAEYHIYNLLAAITNNKYGPRNGPRGYKEPQWFDALKKETLATIEQHKKALKEVAQ